MFTPSFFLASVSLLSTATLFALPMDSLNQSPVSHHSSHFMDSSFDASPLLRTTQARRRSSLMPTNRRRSSQSFTPEETANDSESLASTPSPRSNRSHVSNMDPEAKLSHYNDMMNDAVTAFSNLLTHASLLPHTTSVMPLQEGGLTIQPSLSEFSMTPSTPLYDQALTPQNTSPVGSRTPRNPEHSIEEIPNTLSDTTTLSEDLKTLKSDAVASTYCYTSTLLEILDTLETKDPSEIAAYWEELANRTKVLLSLLKEYEKFSQQEGSSSSIEEIYPDSLFYQARLAEYEAEEASIFAIVDYQQYADILENSDISEPNSSLKKDGDQAAIIKLLAAAPAAFYEAAESYQKLLRKEDFDDIDSFYELMSLWCYARAAEATLQLHTIQMATNHTSSLCPQLTKKAIDAYSLVIARCEKLQPLFSANTDLEVELLETDRYLAQAKKQVLFLELQQQHSHALTYLETSPGASASTREAFSHYKQLARPIRALYDTLVTKNKAANSHLSLWHLLPSREIIAQMACTTEARLQFLIATLIADARTTATRVPLHYLYTHPNGPYLSTQCEASVLEDLSKNTYEVAEAYTSAYDAAFDFPHLLPRGITLEALKKVQEDYLGQYQKEKNFTDKRKQREANAAFLRAQTPSWLSWFCSLFNPCSWLRWCIGANHYTTSTDGSIILNP